MTSNPAAGRKLGEMTPRCALVNTRELRGPVVRDSGIAMDATGWPILKEGESEIGRWHLDSVRLFIDLVPDPNYGPYVRNGAGGLLISTSGILLSIHEGFAASTKLSLTGHKFLVFWPFELMATITASFYEDSPRTHVIIEDTQVDGHLGLGAATIPKARKSNDFLAPVFSAKDRVEQLFDQLRSAHADFAGKV